MDPPRDGNVRSETGRYRRAPCPRRVPSLTLATIADVKFTHSPEVAGLRPRPLDEKAEHEVHPAGEPLLAERAVFLLRGRFEMLRARGTDSCVVEPTACPPLQLIPVGLYHHACLDHVARTVQPISTATSANLATLGIEDLMHTLTEREREGIHGPGRVGSGVPRS